MNFDPVSMPKVELHCHLDGSLSKEFLMQTLQLSTLDMHTIQAPANCQSLAEYLTCFDLPVSALQEKEHIRDAVVDVLFLGHLHALMHLTNIVVWFCN